VWTQITVDEERGLVYLPVETPTSDFYGGHRPGNNLFAESLVCVDLKTGQRKWHFQYIHHGIWDHDNSSAAMLTDVVKDGKVIPAVASPSKQGYVYLFNRVTGEPILPIVETPVPASDVPGEKASPTQPIPMDAHGKPWNYARDFIHVPDDIIDYTPELKREALENLKRYRVEQSPYVPLVLGDVNGKYLGTLNHGNTGGGTNWPGGGLDPETHIFYSQANTAGVTTGIAPRTAAGIQDRHQVRVGREGTRVPDRGRTRVRQRSGRAAARRRAWRRTRRRPRGDDGGAGQAVRRLPRRPLAADAVVPVDPGRRDSRSSNRRTA
jgi:quinoprotein glucose dehydrogenase